MFIRLHAKPKICRNIRIKDFTPKQGWYFDHSLARYYKTEDGKYIREMEKNLNPEIGSVTNFRFIESPILQALNS